MEVVRSRGTKRRLVAVFLFLVIWATLANADGPATVSPLVVDGVNATGGKPADAANLDRLLDMADKAPDQLSQVRVTPESEATRLAVSSNTVTTSESGDKDIKTTSELIQQLPSVTNRRVSGINVDSRVRGYNSAQINANVNGMTERKTVQDLDSLFSQIDPGVVRDMTVIDGPYSSLYGPAFAFLTGNLLSAPRYRNGPETHFATFFDYGSNGQTLYTRENAAAGAQDWGVYFSYGLRTGDDYRSGGSHGFRVPSGYQKWDALASFSVDVNRFSRIEFDCLRTEMNHVDFPGIVYDLDNSTNNQFNLRYIVQEDLRGPQQFVLQAWHQDTFFHGNASGSQKQEFYYQFFTLPYYNDDIVNTLSAGTADSVGIRGLRTFGDADSAQWTMGVDWQRYEQRYTERDLDSSGATTFGGNLFGIPRSRMDDIGALTNLVLPFGERFRMTLGGRVDHAKPTVDGNDPVVTEIRDPDYWYYTPGLSELGRTLGMTYATGNWAISDEFSFTFGTGFAMRMPDLSELYSDDPSVPIARFGNSYASGMSTLAPERNWQADVGISYKKDRLNYGVRGFYATVWNYIMPVPAYTSWGAPGTIQPPHVLGRNFQDFPVDWREDLGTPGENADTVAAGYQYANVDFATLFGGEIFAQAPLRDWLTVYGSMGYVDGTNYRPLAFVYSDAGNSLVRVGNAEGLPGIYPFHGRLVFRVFQPGTERWSVEFVTRMTAAQDHVAVSLSEIPSRAFAVFDIRGHYQLRERLRLTMSVANLLNTYYSEPGSLAIIGPQGLPVFIPEPGISAGVGLEAKF